MFCGNPNSKKGDKTYRLVMSTIWFTILYVEVCRQTESLKSGAYHTDDWRNLQSYKK